MRYDEHQKDVACGLGRGKSQNCGVMDLREREKFLLAMKDMKEHQEMFDIAKSFPYVEEKKPKPIGTLIMDGAVSQHKDIHSAMNEWLDYLIELFDFENVINGKSEEVVAKAKENTYWWEATCRWVHDVANAHRNGRALDFFGGVYEEIFQSKSKADALGQFFTPQSIAKMMSEIVARDADMDLTVTDCACGSGRTMLGAYEVNMQVIDNDERFHFFFGGDIDASSVKMCALNFMIHGLQGMVIRQDALTLEKPSFGYLVNPTNYPVRTGVLSLKYLDSDECAKFVDWQDKDGVYDNMSKHLRLMKWDFDILHGKEHKKIEKKITIDTKRQVPIQLSLFD